VVAVVAIVTHTPPNPHIAFRRAPPYVDIYGGERLGMASTAIRREARLEES
jgi:hypothetical protein